LVSSKSKVRAYPTDALRAFKCLYFTVILSLVSYLQKTLDLAFVEYLTGLYSKERLLGPNVIKLLWP
jgi:hypothetical protein